jgi:hypothetical protein
MTLLYFLPLLIALAFVLVHVARGGKPSLRANPPRQLGFGLAAVIALAAIGAVVAYAAMR